MDLLSPEERQGFDERLGEARDDVKRWRKSKAKTADKNLAKARAKVDKIRAERTALKRKRKSERRARGEALDQRIGKAVAALVDEERARELLDAEIEDIRDDVASGTLDVDAALDRIGERWVDELDYIVDFTKLAKHLRAAGVPTWLAGPVAWGLEQADGPVIKWSWSHFRPVAEARLNEIVDGLVPDDLKAVPEAATGE